MSKYCFIVFFTLLLASVANPLAAADGAADFKNCNGRGNQGEFLLGSKLIMRTGLCEDYDEEKGLLLTQDALKRLAYDAKKDPDSLYQITTAQYAEMYREALINAMASMVDSGYIIDKMAKSNGDKVPDTFDADGSVISSTDISSSNAQDCKADDDASRCNIIAAGDVSAAAGKVLQKLQVIKAQTARNNIMSEIMNKVVLEMEVDTSDEQLKYPKGFDPKERKKE